MERRKFLIGMGSLAAGGAAATGTGAFATQSSGDANIDVVGPDNALLSVDPNTKSDYVVDDNPVKIDLAAISDNGASGITEDSNFVIQPAFSLRNQSSETLYVEIRNPYANNDITSGSSGTSGAGSSAVEGIDVQFLATPSAPISGPPNRKVGMIGRNSLPVNNLGGEFDDPGSNVAYFLQGPGFDLGNRSSLTSGGKGKAGYLEIDPAQSFDVVYHVAVKTPGESTSLSADFQIEAFDDESQMTFDESVDDFIE
jgi:hypothetical protein